MTYVTLLGLLCTTFFSSKNYYLTNYTMGLVCVTIEVMFRTVKRNKTVLYSCLFLAHWFVKERTYIFDINVKATLPRSNTRRRSHIYHWPLPVFCWSHITHQKLPKASNFSSFTGLALMGVTFWVCRSAYSNCRLLFDPEW